MHATIQARKIKKQKQKLHEEIAIDHIANEEVCHNNGQDGGAGRSVDKADGEDKHLAGQPLGIAVFTRLCSS